MRNAKWPVSISLVVMLGAAMALPQERQLKGLMREKLDHSQQILAAVVTSDWPALERHSRDLSRIAEDPAWKAAFTTLMYGRQREAFLRATQDLLDAAQRRDLEAA